MSAEKAAPERQKAGVPLQNAKHELVALKYFADPERIGWRCYQQVYPKSSQRAAETSFSKLLKNPEFSARIENLKSAAADDSVMSAREVLQELSKLGRSNIQNVVVKGDDTTDVVEALQDLAPEFAATIQELTVETYTEGQGEFARDVKRVKVKLHDKRGPLRDLAQHHSLLTEKHELTGKDGGPIETKVEEISELELARRIAFALEQGARSAPRAAAAAPAPKKTKGKTP